MTGNVKKTPFLNQTSSTHLHLWFFLEFISQLNELAYYRRIFKLDLS